MEAVVRVGALVSSHETEFGLASENDLQDDHLSTSVALRSSAFVL